MNTLSSCAAVLALALTSVAACSAQVATPIPRGDGNVAGGTQTGSDQGSAPSSSSSGSSSSGSSGGGGGNGTGGGQGNGTGGGGGGGGGDAPDAGSGVPVSGEAGTTPVDSGSGYLIDAGAPGTGTGTTPSGPPGSCGNPLCATDGNECGCTATDSNGDTIQLGCQAGGQCGCFIDQQLDDNPFDENGACNDAQSAAQQFLQYCSCN
jgi:hypothetical protein